MIKNDNYKMILAVTLVLVAAISRLIPTLPNFQPVIAIALFSGSVLFNNKKIGLILPLAALLLSDILLHLFSESIFGYYIGFHNMMPVVYLGILLVSLFGMLFTKYNKFSSILIGSISASIIFFILSNFGSWLVGLDINGMPYPKTISGLIYCYTEAIPFYRNTFLSTLLFSFGLFGAFHLAGKYLFEPQKAKI